MAAMSWLDGSVLRIGLGCMRLSTDADRDLGRAEETIGAALRAGISIFDTARAYGLDESEFGHNERLVAAALRRHGGEHTARIVTKGGMTRPGGVWMPDGRAASIRRDCEASLAALDGLAIDLYLLHAPDSRVPFRTSVRALARLVDEGLVRHVGVSNVTRQQLDQALDLAPIAAVEIGLSLYDDRAVRGGILAKCDERGLAVLAYSPLGGVKRAPTLTRHPTVHAIAADRGATPAQVALSWLLGLAPTVVPIPGARRAETATSAAAAAGLALTDDERQQLADAFGAAASFTPKRSARGAGPAAEVVVVMGVPGSGKSRLAGDYVDRDFVRLNRDERGGSLRQLAAALEEQLDAGATKVVLDNTYLTRAARSFVLEVTARYGAAARCIWVDAPLDQAQINMVQRLLDRFGRLPSPEELRAAARQEPWLLSPTAQMRTVRELEPPSADEGWDEIVRVPFARAAATSTGAGAVFVAADVIGPRGWEQAISDADPTAPHLVFDWRPEGNAGDLAPQLELLRTVVTGSVEAVVCPHPAGPPICWCRPPLPGLPLAFARTHGLDVPNCTLIGHSSAHRRLATALGARFRS